MTTKSEVKLPELPSSQYMITGGYDNSDMEEYGTLCYEAGLSAGRMQAGRQGQATGKISAEELYKLFHEIFERHTGDHKAPWDGIYPQLRDTWNEFSDEVLKRRIAFNIQEMVNHFLAWKLPKGFSPDAGITFNRQGTDYERGYPWPTGTNLLDATQATEMFEYCAQHPAQAAVPEGWKLVREALEYSLKVQNFAQHVHTARQDRELAAMEPILRKLTEDALKQLP